MRGAAVEPSSAKAPLYLSEDRTEHSTGEDECHDSFYPSSMQQNFSHQRISWTNQIVVPPPTCS